MKMLLFADSLKDASADRITAVIPYLAYSRQDRKVKSREPIYTKYTAKYIEQANINRVLTMDVHNLSAFQNAFRIQTDNLEAKNLLANWLVEHLPPDGQFCVLSPDTGGMGRARRFRDAVSERLGREIDTVCIDKSRVGGVAEGERVIGDVKDKWVILLDDMISSGKTVLVSQKAVEKAGGRIWAVCCTHGLFVGNANEYLAEIPHLVTTDTVLPFRLNDQILNRLHVISTAKLFAQAIRRTHVGDSISELLG
jgi:ribose-phosphate pyrophosphokinase